MTLRGVRNVPNVERPSPLFQMPEMVRLFSGKNHVRQLLAFESALARAEARAGVIPAAAADAIAAACSVESFDIVALYADAESTGSIVIPLVRALTERAGDVGASYVHWGATSQDAIDTALMLQMRAALSLLISEVRKVATECVRLADTHRLTVMAGRTLLQHGVPITFGLKAARWLALTIRLERALCERRDTGLALQFGGAAGTLAALGGDGLRVAECLAAELQLPLPILPWHAERDRIGIIASAVGVAAGGMAKIATDLVLLAQTDVGEVAESAGPGRGTSSAMPQKRNPADSTAALAAARLCAGQVAVVLGAAAHEHERATGAWQVESVAIPELFGFAAGAASRVSRALAGLEVNSARMQENLARDGYMLMAESLTMALAPSLGRPRSHGVTQRVVREAQVAGVSLGERARYDSEIGAVLSREQIDLALDPASYLGSTETFIDRTLDSFRALEQETAGS
ncbi:MAG: adenylosuccinate lyase family protein [Gemmatimonadaceae bacterium]